MKKHENFKLGGVLNYIGNTPLVELDKLYRHKSIKIYAKLEITNPGGSIKDRTAMNILSNAINRGELRPGMTVVESSSGNMAIGLAQACLYLGLKLIVVVDPKVNQQTLKILNAYGVTIEKVKQASESGGYLQARINRVNDIMEGRSDVYWPNQYRNPSNPEAHLKTMKEIVDALDNDLDYLFVSTSTCGTLMGCVDYIKKNNLATKIIAVDAVGSVLFGSESKDRLIPGHGSGRPSYFLEKDEIFKHIHITDLECVTGCYRLLKRESIMCGGSSGAIVMAIEKMLPEIPENSSIATIFCDRGERYLETIYSPEWVNNYFNDKEFHLSSKKNPNLLTSYVNRGDFSNNNSLINIPTSKANHIAIVGGGPKGTYALERLVSQLHKTKNKESVVIHWFNKTKHFGSGEIYNPEQPDYLIINYNVGNVSMWTDDDYEKSDDRKDLTAWLKKEDPLVKTTDYASRATVGQYLQDGVQIILKKLPDNIKQVKFHIAEVVDINPEDNFYKITIKDSNNLKKILNVNFKNILLATGHPRPQENYNVNSAIKLKSSNLENYIPFIYPVKNLNKVKIKSCVLVKGMGLTFIDAVLALTEGRGGKFIENNDGQFNYLESGKEPSMIVPFSRSGMPMFPRAAVISEEKISFRFFNEKELRELSELKGALDFEKDVWPEVKKEMIYTYYRVLYTNLGILYDFNDLSYDSMMATIDKFHCQNKNEKRFNVDEFMNPTKLKRCKTDFELHETTIKFIENSLKKAEYGFGKSPMYTVASVWRKIVPFIREMYLDVGFTPASQKKITEKYHSSLNRISYGPPIENMKKMLALAKSGLLYFGYCISPIIEEDILQNNFKISSNAHDEYMHAGYFIDARIPKISLYKNSGQLYKNLLTKGMIRPHVNELDGTNFEPGCLDVDKKTGCIIDANGQINDSITVMGTPTEGVTYDNDSLSRNCNDFVSNWAKCVVANLNSREVKLKSTLLYK